MREDFEDLYCENRLLKKRNSELLEMLHHVLITTRCEYCGNYITKPIDGE